MKANNSIHHRYLTAALLGSLTSVLAVNWVARADEPAATATASTMATGITRPSDERELKFAAPGILAEVDIKDGDIIKAHQVLAKQDSRQDEQQYLSDKREADSNEKIEYSKADLASKEVDLKRKQELFKDKAASLTEVEQADLAVKLAEAQVKLAIMEHDQKGFEAEKERIKIEQMSLFSPIDGIVEKLNVHAGEMGDPQARDGAVIIGQWNPLWLEMHLPSAQASKLKMFQELQVKYADGKWLSAKIIFFEKVDAASDTQLVRMELVNPENINPGLHMQVKLPADAAVAAR